MWTPVRTADGSWTLRHAGHGQACHSLSGAWQQARERYAAPCRIRELAHERDVVRLLDIGTGLGLNLAAARAALEGTKARLVATTLELDTGVLIAATGLTGWPQDAERFIAPTHAALRSELATPGSSGWLRLELGDARERLPACGDGPFDAVFLDPFSPQVEGDLWAGEFLAAIAARMAPWAVLSTYSASMAVRAGLRAAGLAVGRGPRVGTKAEGTLASFATPLPPLEPRVARKLERRLQREAGGATPEDVAPGLSENS